MQLVHITEANANEHFEFWLQLYRHPAVNPFFFKSMHESNDYMRALFDRYVRNKNVRFLICVDKDQRPVGTCRVTYFEGARSHVAMLNAVAISPEFHGQGLGTRLLKDVENYIQQNSNVTQIELAYEGDNPMGKRVYEEKSQYQRKITYEDWWIRHDQEFQEKFNWYTEERCCVKYLHEVPQNPEHFATQRFVRAIPLPKELSLQSIIGQPSIAAVHAILQTYREVEAKEIISILTKPGQTTYQLMQDDTVLAVLCIRTYDDARLTHSVVMPCVAFNNSLDDHCVAAFISAAIADYRIKHPEIVHIACSEEDTDEQFYTDKHSKISRLNDILNQAEFERLGYFESYFNSEGHSGSALIGFEACFYNLVDAKKCVTSSRVLNLAVKQKLNSLLTELEKYQPVFSNRESYEIYRIVRYIAYPQDYSPETIQSAIAEAIDFLSDAPNFDLYSNDLDNLQEVLYKIIQPKDHSLAVLRVEQEERGQILRNSNFESESLLN
ncbi:MAG: GNAT family N-acetyltransferase [Pseudomonadota bacterium]|nr:GNAT family N-acetyltransferase [Pseudomonadota bacterium]